MSKIWLVRESKDYDTSPARRHGELCAPIYSRRVSPYNFCEQERIIMEEVLPAASRDDFILTCGPQVMVGVLASVFMREHRQVRFLIWHRWDKCYVERCIGEHWRQYVGR
jgi:hypothetical protein